MVQDLPTPSKLASAIRASIEQMRDHLDSREEALHELAGYDFGHGDYFDRRKRPVNMVRQMVETVLPQLVGSGPSIDVHTDNQDNEALSRIYERRLRDWAQSDDFTQTLRVAVLNAMMGSMGVVYVGMEADPEGRYGKPFCVPVEPMDYVYDKRARGDHEIRWEAVRVRMLRSEAMEAYANPAIALSDFPGVASPDRVAEILLSAPSLQQRSDSNYGSSGSDSDIYDVEDTIQLWHVVLHRDDGIFVVTYAADTTSNVVSDEWLSATKWTFDRFGPLRRLTFLVPPGHVDGLSMVSGIRDIHDSALTVADKMLTDFTSSKDILAAPSVNDKDLKAVQEARHGDAVGMMDAESVRMMSFGFDTQRHQGAMSILNGWFNMAGMNLALLGGNRSTAETATEASMLGQNNNIRLSLFQNRVIDFAQRLTDSVLRMIAMSAPVAVPMVLPTGEMSVVMHDPSVDGSLDELKTRVRMNAMSVSDPQMRVIRLFEALDRLMRAIPMVQMGMSIDGLLSILADAVGQQDFDRLFPTGAAQQAAASIAMQKQMQQMAAGSPSPNGPGTPRPGPGFGGRTSPQPSAPDAPQAAQETSNAAV